LKRQYLLFIQDILHAIQKTIAQDRIVGKVLKEEFVELKPKIREVYEHEQKRS
jgi:hypothetical protein